MRVSKGGNMFNKMTSGVGCILAIVACMLHAGAGSGEAAVGWGVAALWALSSFLKD